MTDAKFIDTATRIYATAESLRDFNADIVAQFRANGGAIVTGPMAGAPLLLLTVAGPAGPPLVPRASFAAGDGLVISASKGGAAEHPSWYHSLKAHPLVQVEVGEEIYRASATEVTGDQRDQLYAALATALPVFREYTARTTRVIPVFALERVN